MSGLDFVPGGDGWAFEGFMSGNAETRREPIVAPIPFSRYDFKDDSALRLTDALAELPPEANESGNHESMRPEIPGFLASRFLNRS